MRPLGKFGSRHAVVRSRVDRNINAAQTDLRFAMQLKDRDFIGKSAIVPAMKDSSLPVRVGLQLEGRRAAQKAVRFLSVKRT